MADNAKLKARIAANRAEKKRRRYAEGGPTDSPSVLDALQAQQQMQKTSSMADEIRHRGVVGNIPSDVAVNQPLAYSPVPTEVGRVKAMRMDDEANTTDPAQMTRLVAQSRPQPPAPAAPVPSDPYQALLQASGQASKAVQNPNVQMSDLNTPASMEVAKNNLGTVMATGQGLGPLQMAEQRIGFPVTPRGDILPIAKLQERLGLAQKAYAQGLIDNKTLTDFQRHLDIAKRRGYATGGMVGAVGMAGQDAQADESTPPPGEVHVFDRHGDLGTIPAEQLQGAMQEGYRPAAPEEVQAHFKELKYGTLGQQAKTAAEGALEGLLGPVGPAAEQSFGVSPKDIAGRKEVNPWAHGIAKFGTLAASSIYGVGEGALLNEAGEGAAAAAGLAGEGLPAVQALRSAEHGGVHFIAGSEGTTHVADAIQAAKAAGPQGMAQRVAGGAIRGATENALYQAGDEATKAINDEDPSQTVGTAIVSTGLVGVLGGGAGGMFGAASPLWTSSAAGKLKGALEGAKQDASGLPVTAGADLHPIIKKVLSTYGGVSEKDIDVYLKNREAIQHLPEGDEIFQHALDHVERVNDSVAKTSIDAAQAQQAFSELEQRTTQMYKERGFDAGISQRLAKQTLDAAQDKLATQLQTQAMDAAPKVVDAVEKLRQQVIDGSSGAYDILGKSGHAVNLDQFYAKGSELIDSLRMQGTLEAKAQADRLETYLSSVANDLGHQNVIATRAKAMIQGLDQVSKYDFNASSFDKSLSKQYKQLRHVLDSSLKDSVPGYREAMAPVAEQSRLLGDLHDFGTVDTAVSRIKSLKNPARYKTEMPTLRRLEELTGSKFSDHLEPYANPEVAKRLEEAIPEYAAHRKAAAIASELKDPRTIQAMSDALTASSEHKAMTAARAAKEAAILEKKGLSGVTPNNLENRLTALGRGKKGAQQQFAPFPSMEGQSLEDIMRLKNTQLAFSKGAMNGSRNVNLYGGVLGGIGGALTGHPLGMAGAGATMGGFVDKYGPAAVKKVLDLYLNRFGNIARHAGVASEDALRLATAKAIDADQPANADAFVHTTKLLQQAIKGQSMIEKAAKSVFNSGVETLSAANMPSEATRKALDKAVQTFATNPQALMKVAGQTSYYTPDHGQQLAQQATGAVSYLNSVKPREERQNPMDSKMRPNDIKRGAYARALDIAQQPLVILDAVKKGRLTPQDVVTIKTLYPALYAKLSQQLMSHVVEMSNKGQIVPYSTRLGLSLFLGQPLDSTMTPQAILSSQPKPQAAPPPPQAPKKSTAKLGGMAKAATTGVQSREAVRSGQAKD